jgi:hypothetical protein
MRKPMIHIHYGKGRETVDLSGKEAGQIIVVFALMLTVLIGLVGIAIDVTFAWKNGLQIQRAADAAALAGVVYLPADVGTATLRADAIAQANGYAIGGKTSVVVAPNPANDHQLDVTITAPVQTFFVRLFGINNWTVSKTARAGYVMPVPMGSPLPYYGVGCFVLKTGQATAPACSVATNNGVGDSGVPNGPFTNLGGWGAIITKGGNQNNGDAYSPYYNVGYTPSTNALYDPNGYFYTAVLPAGGTIQVFDPGFCAMGGNPAGTGSYGAGDHWIVSSNTPVSTYYTLWNTNGQPLNPAGWTQTGAASGALFKNENGMDTANGGSGGTGGCDTYHNKWWTLASSLASGTYEVQVSTTDLTDATINQNTNAENMFALSATGAGSAIYGQSRMAVYNNMAGSASGQQFYMARIDAATGAGKSLAIDLFDPGDVGGDAYLQILGPNGPGGTQQQVSFSYTSDSNCQKNGNSGPCSGNNVNQIQTAKGGSSSFQSTWIHILVKLDGTQPYGTGGLWSPPGLTPAQPGWWQVKMITGAANDTTTWSVNVVGNPVHLLPWP